MATKYLKIYHTDSTVNTIKGLFEKEKIYGITEEEFLNVDDGNGSNRKIIFDSMREFDKYENSINVVEDVRVGIKIPVPIVLNLPVDKASKGLIYTQTNYKNVDNVESIVNKTINELYNFSDPEFIAETEEGDDQVFSRANPNISVWIWCKSLSKDVESGDDGGLIDISPFIELVTTNEAENGSNFTIKVAPIPSQYFEEDEGLWRLDNSTYAEYIQDGIVNIISRASPNRTGSLNSYISINTPDGESDELLSPEDSTKIKRRQRFFFHDVINSNDIVFIRFEKLKSEVKRGLNKEYLSISTTELPNQIYDLIGLVDTNTISYGADSATMDITITGRDLNKLLIDDGCFFFNKELVNPDRTGIFRNEKDIKSRSIERLLSNRLNILGIDQNRNLDFILKLLIAQLSNVQICPDTVFDSYQDKTVYQVPVEEQ